MGQEIEYSNFSKQDFIQFKEHLIKETALLSQWFEDAYFNNGEMKCGLELEAWLVDQEGIPAPKNADFIEQINHEMVVPELSKFNFELNTDPYTLSPSMLKDMEAELSATWGLCQDKAKQMHLDTTMIGTIPTLVDNMLTPEYMSISKRYEALNEQLLSYKKDHINTFSISAKDSLHVEHRDIMLEAAATSLQIHLQPPTDQIIRYYNASVIASAATVAAGANAPYMYEKELWDETRIALFESAISSAGYEDGKGNYNGRVTFGAGYIEHSIIEVFLENLACYPVLLPTRQEGDDYKLNYLRLHNGTIWRWNRPLVSPPSSKGGRPSVRIEHRVISAGPTIPDVIANIAFYVGLTAALANLPKPPEQALPFEQAKTNFYEAAKHGLLAQVTWIDGKSYDMQSLLIKQLLPLARQGLELLAVEDDTIMHYLDEIMYPRILSGQNGALWQRNFIAMHGHDFQLMTKTYMDNQKRHIPVHTWQI